MRKLGLAAAVALVISTVSAASAAERQLEGVTAEEAASIITTLEKGQKALRAGEFQRFTLLAGSVASYEATNIPAREAFLSIPFNEVWRISRAEAETIAWQPFRLSYAPDGLGQRYWDIEVVVGSNGGLELVTLNYKVPPPF
ncbi:hypothetical protein [Altererythrobacter aquiaggeris]|uniref:hypothetical protein n=1 Tax=Aestuarierythrobacter aquiaggeris TaxID=1898396 RepID=UPI003019EA05